MLNSADAAATLPVSDLERAKKFYEETLGLKKMDEGPAGVKYQSGNCVVFVYPSQFAGTNQATAVAWNLDSGIEAVVTDLKAKGVTFEQYDNLPGVTREGDIHTMGTAKAVWFKDTEGNILNVTQGM